MEQNNQTIISSGATSPVSPVEIGNPSKNSLVRVSVYILIGLLGLAIVLIFVWKIFLNQNTRGVRSNQNSSVILPTPKQILNNKGDVETINFEAKFLGHEDIPIRKAFSINLNLHAKNTVHPNSVAYQIIEQETTGRGSRVIYDQDRLTEFENVYAVSPSGTYVSGCTDFTNQICKTKNMYTSQLINVPGGSVWSADERLVVGQDEDRSEYKYAIYSLDVGQAMIHIEPGLEPLGWLPDNTRLVMKTVVPNTVDGLGFRSPVSFYILDVVKVLNSDKLMVGEKDLESLKNISPCGMPLLSGEKIYCIQESATAIHPPHFKIEEGAESESWFVLIEQSINQTEVRNARQVTNFAIYGVLDMGVIDPTHLLVYQYSEDSRYLVVNTITGKFQYFPSPKFKDANDEVKFRMFLGQL